MDAVAIDIDTAVLRSVESNIKGLNRYPMAVDGFTIFRVPAYIRQRNQHLYEPRMVSIGPYGRGDRPVLGAMEQHKSRYLQDFLFRNPNNRIEHYIAEIRALEPEARLCYSEPVELSAEKFVELLLLDGCFIFEFLFKWYEGDNNSVCTAGWSLPLINDDLLLLENQIPLFVLEKLFELLVFTMDGNVPSLRELLVNYLTSENIESPEEEMLDSRVFDPVLAPGEAKYFHHLLHLYYRCYVLKPQTDPTGSTICSTILKWLKSSKICASLLSYLRFKNDGLHTDPAGKKRSPNTIPSATVLLEAGVTFRKKNHYLHHHPGSFLDVTFHGGVLEIPFLSVNNSTLSRFTNLVAFEQCSGYKPEEAYMTTYATFMNCIIDTPRDVAILQQSGILENQLASDMDLAVFFNEFSNCPAMYYKQHYLAGLFREVRKYCNSDWNKWKAKLVRDYFTYPWPILSLSVAAVILISTLVQAYFAVYSYYQPRK